jgi:Holliday junction resolvase-like predicted endonuclease
VSVERNLVISLLKLTKEGAVLVESVNKEARIPSAVAWKLLEKLQKENLIYLKPDSVSVDSASRLKLALKAASLGADVEHISDLLCWQEFEEIAAIALKNNGYTVKNNVRFTHEKKRWEIDVVGCRKPLVICIDCKHWQQAISPSALRRIVDLQTKRTRALADSLPNTKLKLDCVKWEKAKFIPAVLSLIPSAFKFCEKVPVVPVLQLQDFICQLPAYTESMKVFSKTFKSLSHDFQNLGFS